MSHDDGATLAAVQLKLPPFWPADPQLWFIQVEAQFSTRGITAQKTKFDQVVASLAPEFAAEVRDLLLSPPASQPYDTLKAQLIKRTEVSEQRRLQQLFSAEDIGDRRPTQLLRKMQQLLGDKASGTDSALLRQLFIQRLSPSVRMVLASTPDATPLEELAQLADKVSEVATPTVAAINPTSNLSEEIEQLRKDVASLHKLVKSGRKKRSPSPHRPPHSQQEDLCWYHSRFGDKARKCQPPCSYVGNDSASH